MGDSESEHPIPGLNLPQTESVFKSPDSLFNIKQNLGRIIGSEIKDPKDAERIRDSMAAEAGTFLEFFRVNNFVEQDTIDSTLAIWKNVIFLSDEQLRRLGEVHASIYREAQNFYTGLDEGIVDNAEDLAEKAKNIAEIHEVAFTSGPGMIYRPYADRPSPIATGALPAKIILINADSIEEFSSNQDRLRTLVFEETAHLISNLERYGSDLKKGWVEETMSRFAGISARHKSENTLNDPESLKHIAEDLNLFRYIYLYYLVTRELDDPNLLWRVFLGKEPVESPDIEQLGNAISKYDLLGKLLNTGMPMGVISDVLSDL